MHITQDNSPYLRNGHFYDLAYKEQKEDINFYVKNVLAVQGECLEIGAGSGRITIPIHNAGINITGLEPSTTMLEEAQKKEPSIHWVNGKAETFSFKKTFKTILMPFRVIQLIYDFDTLEKALTNIYQHLDDDGVFIFDVFNPQIESMNTSTAPKMQDSVINIPETNEGILIEYEKHYDQATQINNIIFHYTSMKTKETTQELLKMRCYFPQEIDFILKSFDFVIVNKFGNFSEDAFTAKSNDQIFICKKKNT